MHVPDGVLPLWLQILMLIVSGAFLIFSLIMINKKLDERVVPYIGVLAAVIFAAQFVNFPVPPYSSGHLIGATLLAMMVGPWVGIIIIALVLFIQALYGDGGLLMYGLNLFNMGVFSCLFAWTLGVLIFKTARKKLSEKSALLLSAAITSYIVTVAAAFVLGLELMTEPAFGFTALVAITSIHSIIAIGEAILTVVILEYFVRAKPTLIALLKGSKTRDAADVPIKPLSIDSVQEG